MIYGNPMNKKYEENLRNKGLVLIKSMFTNFSDYIDYNKAMTIYNLLNKLTNFGKTILYIISPNSFQYLSNDQYKWYDFSEYMNLYHKFLNPSNIIPPFKGKVSILCNIFSNNIREVIPYYTDVILFYLFFNRTYTAKGTIIASNNIITFNKQPYSITPDTGSYILANDFKNNKFSILANYKENILASISLSSYNSDTYELHPGGSVSKN